ncbi:MAG: iron-sulfur cluster assembly protein [Sulfobacillus thermotolerans]|nr:iron-sulfur cluster assembly protein [Sulfobacillus thermotolerans]
MDASTRFLTEEVWRALEDVTDPELDEPVADLGFISQITCLEHAVTLTLRLPTYWCSPNFAYLMMEDLQRAIQRLPWVKEVRITLQDHESAEPLNRAIEQQVPFAQAFHTAGDLDDLRRAFQEKAFYARQKRLIDGIVTATGIDVVAWLPGRVRDVAAWAERYEALRPLWRRYQTIVVQRNIAFDDPEAPVIVDAQGRPVAAQAWMRHWHSLRLVTLNMEANTHLCRGLYQTRYGPDHHPREGDLPLLF